MIRPRLTIAALAALLASTAATAAAQADNPAVTQSMGMAIVKTIAALLFILGLFFLLVYLLKRYSPQLFGGRSEKKGGSAGIDVITVKPMGGKRFLYLVQVEDRRILLGVTEQSINRIAEWQTGEPEKDSTP